MAGRYVKVTPEMAEQAVREIDWARIDAMTDEDIARQVAETPDAAPIMTPAQIRAARVRHARRRSGPARGTSRRASASRSARCAIGSRGGGSRTPRRSPTCA